MIKMTRRISPQRPLLPHPCDLVTACAGLGALIPTPLSHGPSCRRSDRRNTWRGLARLTYRKTGQGAQI